MHDGPDAPGSQALLSAAETTLAGHGGVEGHTGVAQGESGHDVRVTTLHPNRHIAPHGQSDPDGPAVSGASDKIRMGVDQMAEGVRV